MNLQSNTNKPLVSIVVPVYNESDVLEKLLTEIIRSTRNFIKDPSEIIVVNDHSTDRTRSIAESFEKRGEIILVDSNNHQGKGGALRAGFDRALGDYIVMMDGDGSHKPEDIPKLIEELKKSSGLVIASRIYGGSEEYSRIRATGNLFLTWMFGMLHGRYLSDALNGFKAFHRDVYKNFKYSSNGYEIEIELLANTLRLGRQITEVPSLELKRQGGEMKSRVIKDGFKFLFRIILEKMRNR